MESAVEVLARDGYLDDAESESMAEYFIKLKTAAAKYREASVAKGSDRSNEECRDAILVAFFEAHLADFTSEIN